MKYVYRILIILVITCNASEYSELTKSNPIVIPNNDALNISSPASGRRNVIISTSPDSPLSENNNFHSNIQRLKLAGSYNCMFTLHEYDSEISHRSFSPDLMIDSTNSCTSIKSPRTSPIDPKKAYSVPLDQEDVLSCASYDANHSYNGHDYLQLDDDLIDY